MKDRQHNRLKKKEQKANNFDKILHRKLKLININLLKTGYNHLLRKSKKFLLHNCIPLMLFDTHIL